MIIRVEKVLDRRTDIMRVEFNYNFLKLGYARKVCVVEAGTIIRFPQHGAHSHNSGHWLIPLLGTMRLAYDHNGLIQILQLETGKYYYVPPNVPHQVEICGVAVLESYAPSAAVVWDKARRGMTFYEDFFKKAAEQIHTE